MNEFINMALAAIEKTNFAEVADAHVEISDGEIRYKFWANAKTFELYAFFGPKSRLNIVGEWGNGSFSKQLEIAAQTFKKLAEIAHA